MPREIAKITKPALRRALPRPPLFERLDLATARHPITWVNAGAGAGKTVLVASWLQARKRPALWYQIDARDADPASFFYFVREAAARLAPRKRETLPLLTPEYGLGLEAYVRSFFEQLGARLRPGTVIVLDDYHELPEEAPLQLLMPLALASLPEGVRAVVASRAAPPAAFARLVAHGRVARVAARELNLTTEQTRELARLHGGRGLSHDAAAALRDRTDGWMAGTVLLLQGGADEGRDERHGGGPEARDVLFEYFASELFDRAPAGVRRFLLETALLPRVSAEAAKALTGEDDAGEILSALVRRNYFTMLLSGHEARYRYHPLFREFLLARARRGHSPEQWSALVRRAVDVLLEEGEADHAAALMIDARDHAALARLVLELAPELVRQGRLATVESWLRALPEKQVGRSAMLSYWLGQCEAARSPPAARSALERAYELFKRDDDPAGMFLAWAGVVETYLYVWDRFGPLDHWIAELEALRRRHPAFPSLEIEARVTHGAMSALMWRNVAHPELDAWLGRARALLRADLASELRMRLATTLVFFALWWRGDQKEAARLLAEMRPLLQERDVTPIVELMWRIMEAAHHARVAEPEACFRAVERGLAKAGSSGVLGLNLTLAMQGVYGALAAGDLDAARRYHDHARTFLGAEEAPRAIAPPPRAFDAAHFHYLATWIALCANDLSEAESHAVPMEEHAAPSGADLVTPLRAHTVAHVLAGRGRYAEALRELSVSLAWGRDRASHLTVHHCLLSEAWVLLLAGRERDAVEKLREGMAFGREHGYVSHPWIGWRRDVMARLAAVALEHGVEPDHVRAQIRASRLAPPEPSTALDAWPWPVRIHTLGPFELWRGDERVDFTGKVQRKPLELLEALVALGAKDVREEFLVDALWPEAEGDAARHALETTLYRLRRLIGVREAIVQRDRKLSLDVRVCWVDAFALEWRLREALSQDAVAAEEAERIAHLYRGPFLAGGGADLPSVTIVRARLRRDLSRLLAKVERQRSRSAAGPPLRERLAAVDAEVSAAGRS